jgi:hypothetical protein
MLGLGIFCDGQSIAARYVPGADSLSLERLSFKPNDSVARELAQMRATQQRDPRNLDAAVACSSILRNGGRRGRSPASVVTAALNNVLPVFREGHWAMVFSFGLILGFDFASVLTDLGLPRDTLALALVGFNLGVETGQLAIVACFLPVAFLLRNTMFYWRFVLSGVRW